MANVSSRRTASVYADSTLFKVFTHPAIKGDPATMLNRPYTMVMTESLARKYFGNEDPIGKTVKSVEGNLYEITGVIKDLPGNLHLRFNGILSVATIRQQIGVAQFNDRSAGSFLECWHIHLYHAQRREPILSRSLKNSPISIINT